MEIRLPQNVFSWNSNIYRKSVQRTQVSLKPDRGKGYITWILMILFIISRWIILRMRNVWDKRCKKIKTRILRSITLFFFFFFRKSCLLWDNVEKYCRDGHATDDKILRSCFLSHPALGWLKVGYDMDKLDCQNWIYTFSFSLYGYRLAIGYFRVAKGGGENYPRFPCEFRGHGPTYCFWFWSTRGLGFGRPAGAVDSSLEAPWVNSRAIVRPEGLCQRKITRVLPACSTVPQPTAPTRAAL
jgi:hypothetical protein